MDRRKIFVLVLVLVGLIDCVAVIYFYNPDIFFKVCKEETSKPYDVDVKEDYYTKCKIEDEKNDEMNPLSDNKIGSNKCNEKYVFTEGDTFYRKYVDAYCTVNSIKILDKMPKLNPEYMAPYMKETILPNMNEDGTLSNIELCLVSGEPLNNSGFKYVMVSITVKAGSDSGGEIDITPELCKYVYYEGALTRFEDYEKFYYEYKPLKTQETAYLDIGTYKDEKDVNEEDYGNFRMKVGESITYNCLYLVPNIYLDNAYLCFDDIKDYQFNTYNSLGGVNLIKITNMKVD